jgi:ABC-type Fe3+/spermidine/putrescine transport system ATPase subunit
MLKCTGLSKTFEKNLFDKFDLHVGSGQIVAITGPSGCGKTTLLRCICGLEELDEGQIILGELNITNMLPEDRGIGLIFQRPVLYPHLNVEKNLKLGDKNADVSIALTEVGLTGFEKRQVDTLSGGEGQRVALARALLANPSVLLLDEPFSSLDDDLSEKLATEVRELLKNRGCPAVLVTHNKSIAKLFADVVLSLD